MASLKDIANIVGVNVSTVSKALNGASDIGNEMAQHIISVAKELDYKSNRYKATLRAPVSRLIGVISPEINSNFYSVITTAAQRVFNENGYTLVAAFSGFDSNYEAELLHVFLGHHVDGVLIICPQSQVLKRELENLRRKSAIPVVEIMNSYEGKVMNGAYDSYTVDSEYGMELAINHLAALGHTRIAFIGEEFCLSRRALFFQCLARRGIPYDADLVRIGSERFEYGGYLRMKELLQGKLPTAVVAGYDNLAIGAMRAVREHGYLIPEDISFIGNDEITSSPFLENPLTSINTPMAQLGELAANKILHALSQKEPLVEAKHVLLKPNLEVRATTAPPSKRR